MRALRGLRAAFVFLTRVPVGGFPYSDAEWRSSTAWFPLVGLVIGLGMAAVYALFDPLGSWVGAICAVAFGALVTGGFHEDGLADTADAMGGSYDREKLFAILKDSRVGAFGVLALTLTVFLRVALLARLGAAAIPALILTQCAARTPPIWLMATLPYVTADAAAKSRQVSRAGRREAIVATVWPAIVMLLLLATHWLRPMRVLWLVLVAIMIALVAGRRFVVRAGGVTGDFLGATEQLVEVALLMVLAWPR